MWGELVWHRRCVCGAHRPVRLQETQPAGVISRLPVKTSQWYFAYALVVWTVFVLCAGCASPANYAVTEPLALSTSTPAAPATPIPVSRPCLCEDRSQSPSHWWYNRNTEQRGEAYPLENDNGS